MAPSHDASSAPSAAEIDAIATRTFSTSFRGWDPDEVRVHLVEVAEMVRALLRIQSDLERRLVEAEAAARRADLTQLDPDEVDRILGEETARVLRTARESAAEISRKAVEQAELLARQAADDAARAREQALVDAQRRAQDATEEADAIRSAGEAHVAEWRAAAESEIEELRVSLEAENATVRQTARDESAAALAAAEDAAAAIRSEAADAAAALREESERDAEHRRIELDREITERHAALEAELEALTDAARTQVDEAERMRERVLADLARRRKAARQHLEQLQAGRERLLAAYEIIRATTDAATDELSVVLTDAKRAADEAARRVRDEPIPGSDEMLAELDLARMADLPLIAGPAAETTAPVEDESAVNDSAAPQESGAEASGSHDAAVSAGNELNAAASDAASSDAVEDVASASSADVSSQEDQGAPEEDGPKEAIPTPRRSGRLRKRRGDDPLGGESLPEVPMTPLEGSAEFEAVRIVPAPETQVADDNQAPSTGVVAVPNDPAQAGATATADTPDAPEAREGGQPGTTSGAERALATVAQSRAETTETSPESATRSSASDAGEIDDEVTDIFARLRAGQQEKSAGVPDAAVDESIETKPKAKPAPRSRPSPKAPTGKRPDAKDATKNDVPGGDRIDAVIPDSVSALARIFERRDAAVDEVARRLAKHLKRQLSDHQSELLDELRRARKVASVEELIGGPDEFRTEWTPRALEDLTGAVAAGVLLAGELCEGAGDHADVDLDVVIGELVDAVGRPLYSRLERVLSEGDGTGPGDDEDESATADDRDLADRVRACYREWRGARLSAAVADACSRAFGEGLRGALPPDVGVSWYCGPGEQPCSDCEDNQLAGEIGSDAAFPTGRKSAPAHPGCRCLALPTLPG